jgi:ubiquinone/menaquinone biosynthesis C-methylase UbiE
VAHSPSQSGAGDTSGARVRPVRAAVSALLRLAPQLTPWVQKHLWRAFYELASARSQTGALALMNYGYAGAEATADGGPEDRYGQELYEVVVAPGDLAGRDVLEVGCGRGGGAAFVYGRFAPRSLVGVDLARVAVRQARRRYGRPGLTFVTGDAEELPFPDDCFDVVVSVESTHCYPAPDRFLREVRRVLHPGGLLLLADFRRSSADGTAGGDTDEVTMLRRQILNGGFRTLEEENITPAVVRALALRSPTARARIKQRVPPPLRHHAEEFSAVEGSAVYRAFAAGDLSYLRFALAAT